MEENQKSAANCFMECPVWATALNPVIGYDYAAIVTDRAKTGKKSIRQVVVELGYLTDSEAEILPDSISMTKPEYCEKW